MDNLNSGNSTNSFKPNRKYIEVGSDTEISVAHEFKNANSGEYNKTNAQLTSSLNNNEAVILSAVGEDFADLLKAKL